MASTKSKASAVVLASFDLIEDIILRLPLREVLLVKGVCKTWKGIHDQSTRIQKVLFLTPAFEEKIYYPNCSHPTWYLAPGRDELIAAGLVSEPVEGSDGDVTPTNSPKQRNARMQADQVKSATYVDNSSPVSPAGKEVSDKGKGKLDPLFTTVGEHETGDEEADGKGLGNTKVVSKTRKVRFVTDDNQVEFGEHEVKDKTDGKVFVNLKVVSNTGEHKSVTHGSKAAAYGTPEIVSKNTCRALVSYKADSPETTGDNTTEEVDLNNYVNIFGRKASGTNDPTADERTAQYEFINSIPRLPASPDRKMLVSQVTPPFINPFFEIIFERFFRGSRGRYYPADGKFYPGTNMPASVDLVVRPQIQLPDGTTVGRSRKTRAVQRNNASWRKMHPFSALVSSIEVECFDFGAFEVYADWGMLAGHMMDQLGKHWGERCPECCILDFWFSEFIKEVCHTDNSHWNRGKHGVKKLGLDHTGWEILAMMNAGQVEVTPFKDRIRPF